MNPFGNYIDIPAGQSRTIKKRIFWNQNLYSYLSYSKSNQTYLYLDVYSERSNLHVLNPTVNLNTGELIIPWGVSTQWPFNPVAYSSIKLWASNAHNEYGQLLGTWGLGECHYKSSCTGHIKVPLSERVAIPRGKTSLETYIDSERGLAETDDSDANNHKTNYLDNFFSESIPDIMNAKQWGLAAVYLNMWLDRVAKLKDPSVNGIDWKLTTIIGWTSWFLDPNIASNNRIIDNFNKIINPTIFNTQPFRNVLKIQLKDKFTPGVTQVKLSKPYKDGDNIRDYHKLHAQVREAQNIYSSDYDEVTAAFGNFSFYLVPRGTAKILNSQQYQVTINKVAIHVIDSYDFNGSQTLGLGLGCWKAPDKVLWHWAPGYVCVSNSTYRNYRNMKARGWDYNIFKKPHVVSLATPLVFNLARN